MYQLVYLSRAAYPMSDDELDEILLSSRRNNPCKDITGLLLYAHDTFFQVLEGRQNKVEELYEDLHADDRHLEPRILHAANIDARMFESWAMGFERFDEENREFAFLVSLSERSFAGGASAEDGAELLKQMTELSHKLAKAA